MSDSSYAAARWLPGAHLQTAWGTLARPRRAITTRREILRTPDDDELIVDHCDVPDATRRVVLLHGLEGSSNSVYVQGMMKLLRESGVSASAMNFRSCARDPLNLNRSIPNHAARFYHSGETTDFDFLVGVLRARAPQERLAAIGVSLGGNVLLKWLGEHAGQTAVERASAISTPYDLSAGARHLERGMGRIYVARFLRTLKVKAAAAAERFPAARERMDMELAMRARTFWEFDEGATGPLHGFAGADDYYARCSSLGFVDAIDTPTLCISAIDDPFLPESVLQRVDQRRSKSVELVVTERGGHVGFVVGWPFRWQHWAEDRAVDWVTRRV
jgi:uncharacterized protein